MTVVTKFAERNDYTDGFLIETDIDEETVGYYTSNYDYPVCNHRYGVTDKNIGYAKLYQSIRKLVLFTTYMVPI